MTAKIKLNAASGGGSFILQAPSSSSNNRVMSLPDTADGTILTTTNPKTGNSIQVLQMLNTTITDYSASASYRDIGIFQAITPSATSSRILIQASVTCGFGSGSNQGYSVGFQILRDSTVVPTAPSTSGQTSTFALSTTGSNDDDCGTVTFSYIDTPSTTSATTYKLQALARDGRGFTINASSDHSDDTTANYRQRGQSTLTLMEIAA